MLVTWKPNIVVAGWQHSNIFHVNLSYSVAILILSLTLIQSVLTGQTVKCKLFMYRLSTGFLGLWIVTFLLSPRSTMYINICLSKTLVSTLLKLLLYFLLQVTIIKRILTTVLFSIYHLLLLLHLLNCAMSVLSLNSYWFGLDCTLPIDINCNPKGFL